MGAPEFGGGTEPIQADQWRVHIENTFKVFKCTTGVIGCLHVQGRNRRLVEKC